MGTSGLGALLVEEGLLTENDRLTIRRTSGSVGSAFARGVIALGLLDEDELVTFLAEHTRFRVAAKDLFKARDESALDLIDAPLLERFGAVPLRAEGKTLFVALPDPLDRETLYQLEFFSGYKVVPEIATFSQIDRCLEKLIKGYKAPRSELEDFLINHAVPATRRQRIVDPKARLSLSRPAGKDRPAPSPEWQRLTPPGQSPQKTSTRVAAQLKEPKPMAAPTPLAGKSDDFADKRAIPSSDESRAPVDHEASQNDFFAELDGPDDAITTHHAPPPSQASRSPTKISPTTLGDPESESPDLSDSSPFDDTAAVDLFGADAEEANDEASDASQGPQDAMIEELGGVSSDRVSDHGVSNESLSEDDEAALNAALKDLGRGALTQRPSPSRNRDTVGRVVVSDEASNNFDEQTPDSLDHLLADEADTELIEDASAQQATDPIDLLDSTPDETINSLDELGTDQANADLIEEASADPATDSIDLFDATQDETATDLVTDADDLLDPNTIDGASTALHLSDGEDAAESTAPPSRSEDEDDPLASLDHEETSTSKAYAVAANRALLALNLAGDDAQTAAVAAAPALAAAGLGPGVLITMATTGELTPLCLWRTSTGRPNVNAADLARYAPISLINAMAAFSASWSNGEKLSQAPGLAHLREWKKDAPDSKLLACVLPTASGSKLAVLVAAAPEFSANHSIQDAVSALLGALARAC